MKTRRMMTLIGLAIAVALIAVPAASAQQRFNPEIGNGQWSAVEPPVSTAYADNGYFNPEIGNGPRPDAFAFWTTSEELAMGSGEENFVTVSQIVEDDYVPEGQSVYVLVTHRLPVQTAAREIALRGK